MEALMQAHGARFDPLLRCVAQQRDPFDGSELLRYAVRLRLPMNAARVFDCLRNLECLADWWPRAIRVRSLPPGVFGVGDMGIVELTHDTAWFRVMHYKPDRRLVLALVSRKDVLLIDLRWHEPDKLELVLEAPRRGRRFGAFWQSLWLKLLCVRASRALEKHLAG